MPIVLSDLFSEAEAMVIYEAAQALPFEDGGKTAGRVAGAVKRNQQAAAGADRDAVLAKVKSVCLSNPLFQAVVYPKGFAGMVLSRTEGGGEYGDHIDNALMAGGRTDVSFTIFLSPPESYDGGALCISDPSEERSFKLEQGEMVIYPSDTLHRVEEVTSGVRIAIAGWATSWVRDPRQREILFDLWQAHGRAEAVGDVTQALLLSKSRSNLLRMWAV
ncbi:Fe2+-dependent dioxygenase [Alisedimentitalea sp. MJ-SS2]|uniref:Fe2+-dependent dioxygenase n=1 Tax=Aliisedimentitalea sp. MJ-SS2 TaxID=3049795 RepID=UPI00290A81C7|nr:Fe2+-dependent dioxygenase [Alisedimentitalea sp. MJ-SS2]MDU8925994.1 Fe2+-dependent dioxygenase [Alisedimentitalea sp. MJ-SS2]